MSSILIVDDEPNIQELARLYLEKEGYRVDTAGTGRDALAKLETAKPALVILDIMLPDTDGFEICREIRRKSEVPILMLTARKDDIDKILGLELGADDYLTKPFNPRELVARVKAVLRRYAGGQKPGKPIETGNLKIDISRREVAINGSIVKLRTKEFDLLNVLAQNFGIVMTRERLLEIIWDTDYYGETRTVDIHVNHVRDKIEGADVAIETVRGVGYKLTYRTGPVEDGKPGSRNNVDTQKDS
jgi:two-component system alkaline phosphatase synthesis response regulator PhoP